MIIMTLNCGSSSVKYQLYDWEAKTVIAKGMVERVTLGNSFISHKTKGKDEYKSDYDCPTHKVAIELIIKTILDPEYGAIDDINVIKAVGHRVVHGGAAFNKSAIIDSKAMAAIQSVQDLSPLHNPANIMGIEAAQAVLPSVPHCAVMDTAWHQTMPDYAFMYAVPYPWYEKYGVRRYGFHGTSFLYCAKRAAALLGKDTFKTNLIIAHIGNGASMCAIKDGISVDTTMGMTPLEGLIMGTRSGDMDPAISFYLMRSAGLTGDEVDTALNKKSGILGITEKWADRRDVSDAAKQGDPRAKLAQNMEAYRIKKYIGSYKAAIGWIDAIVFTAGVGEMSTVIREKALENLEGLGIKIDREKNALARTRNAETCISADDSPVKIYVIPTDEELVMTEDTYALLQGTYDVHTNFSYSFQKKDYVNHEREENLQKELTKNPDLAKIIAKP